MTYKTDNKRFVYQSIVSIFFVIAFSVTALFIYFLLPTDIKENTSTVAQIEESAVEANIENDEHSGPTEFEFSQAFLNFVNESSQNLLTLKLTGSANYNEDSELSYYRQDESRFAVEWFYTHITGNEEIARAILSEADRNDIPPSMAFALAYIESRYNAAAIHNNSNNTIDRGLFQLNSNTFQNLTEEDFFNPSISAKYGMSHLKFCLTTAGNEVSALAMYNAGTTRVRSNKTPQTTLNYVGNILTYKAMLETLFEQEVVTYFEPHLVPVTTVAIAASDKH